jgi:hypothetical protein
MECDIPIWYTSMFSIDKIVESQKYRDQRRRQWRMGDKNRNRDEVQSVRKEPNETAEPHMVEHSRPNIRFFGEVVVEDDLRSSPLERK